MAETKKPYGWFDLPPEIRNMIAEALGVLYGENTMQLDNAPEATDLVPRLIGRENAHFIRRAAFPYPCQPFLSCYIGTAYDDDEHKKDEPNAVACLAAHCPGLREIVLEEVAILDDWLDPDGLEEMEEVLEAFSRLNAQLWTAFPCLQRVVAHLRPPNPFTPRSLPALEDKMRKAGWTVVEDDMGGEGVSAKSL